MEIGKGANRLEKGFRLKYYYVRENTQIYAHLNISVLPDINWILGELVKAFSLFLCLRLHIGLKNVRLSLVGCLLHILNSKRVSILIEAFLPNVVPSLLCISWFKESKHTHSSLFAKCCTFPFINKKLRLTFLNYSTCL